MKLSPMLLWLLVACESGKSAPAPTSRVEAVSAKRSDDSAASFCDVAPVGDAAPLFRLPTLAGPAPAETKGARWINVWATWCPPCVEELPRLSELVETLRKGGTEVALQLVSVDASDEAIADFAKAHPEVKSSPRIGALADLEPWLASLGLDKGATLPVHVFVRADGKVACARTGAVRDSDLPAIRKLLSGTR